MAVLVAAAVLFFLSFACLGVCVLMATMTMGDRRLAARLRRCDPTTPGGLVSASRLPARVLVGGRTAPGPGGPQVAPASGRDCVWFRTSVVDRTSDTHVSYVHLHGGGDRIALQGGGGAVLLDVKLAFRVDSHPVIHRMLSEEHGFHRSRDKPMPPGFARLARERLLPDSVVPRFGTRRLDLTEQTIAPDVDVSVFARPVRTREGYVVLTGRGDVTTGTPSEWLAALTHGVGEGWFSVKALFVAGVACGLAGAAACWVTTL